MTDHRWLTLARTISRWPESSGGFVVTRKDKIVIGTGDITKAAEHWNNSSVYFVGQTDQVLGSEFDSVARLIIPDTCILIGVSLDVEVEQIEL